MIVRRLASHPQLEGVVRYYQSRAARPGESTRRVALPARTDVLLEFYFTEPHLLELQATRTLERAPRVVVVGPQTFRRVDLILSGSMDIFTIHFAPTGLYLLLGIPMTELTDAGVEAGAVFGWRTIEDLYGRLSETTDFAARARITDAAILALLACRRRPIGNDAMGDVLLRIGRPGTDDSMNMLADYAGLSQRQFRRMFARHVGMAPKKYVRILRLEAALALRETTPEKTWTDIAYDCGWFDQAHMDKDFLALTGAPPSRFLVATRA